MTDKKTLITIQDNLTDVTNLVAFLQHDSLSEVSMNEQAKNGLFVFLTDILNRLNSIQDSIHDVVRTLET